MHEQSKLASMGEMIGNIAHQWRQPLSVISIGVTGMQLKKEYGELPDKEFNSTCDVINTNTQFLSRTIDYFRDYIKGGSEKTEVNLEENISSFIKLVDSTIKEYNITLILDINENIVIESYPNQLIQCYINIYNNAKDALIKNNSEENRYIFISKKIIDENIVIVFRDNAGGIDEDILPKIFEPYFTTKHQSQGTGLGLHMTYNLIINNMKGTLEAKNIEYTYKNKNLKGVEFIISLPRG